MTNSESTHVLTREQLAKLLDVTPDAVSQASKKSNLCKGYPIAEWAEISTRGEIVSYHVPDNILTEIVSKMASNRLTEVSKRLEEANSDNGLIKLINGFIKMIISLLNLIPTGLKMKLIKPKHINISHRRGQKKMANSFRYTLGSTEKDQ